jgi:hypothetical protein
VLGTIYSIFRGDQTLKLVLEYGALGEVFSRRYPRVKAESDSYFARHRTSQLNISFTNFWNGQLATQVGGMT